VYLGANFILRTALCRAPRDDPGTAADIAKKEQDSEQNRCHPRSDIGSNADAGGEKGSAREVCEPWDRWNKRDDWERWSRGSCPDEVLDAESDEGDGEDEAALFDDRFHDVRHSRGRRLGHGMRLAISKQVLAAKNAGPSRLGVNKTPCEAQGRPALRWQCECRDKSANEHRPRIVRRRHELNPESTCAKLRGI
jgi:hypothetical protein